MIKGFGAWARRIGLGLAGVLGACTTSPGTPPSLDRVLALARDSYSVTPSPTGYTLAGSGEFLGAPAAFGVVFDGAGPFAVSYTGVLAQATGFDGVDAWERDWAGSSRRLYGGERIANLLPTWLLTGAWVDRAKELDLQVEPGDAPVALSFAPGGYAPRGRIELDPGSMQPRLARWGAGEQLREITFGPAKDFGLLTLPASFTDVAGPTRTTTTIDSVEPSPVFIRSPYAYLGGGATARFDPDTPAALAVKRTPTGHVLVKGLIDGQDLGWFIFDTGAGADIISQSAAATLGLEGVGSVNAAGVGGSVPTAFFKARTLTIGPATIDEPVLVGLDLAFLEPIFGERIAGIVGYTMLTRVIAEVDMAGGSVSLFDSRTYARTGVDWTPARLVQRHPCIEAEFEGRTALFRIDTGAGADTVIFHADTVAALGLLDGRETTPSTLGGVGGAIPAAKGTLRDFSIAGRRHEKVVATFALPGGRAFNDPWIGGTLGGGFLGEVIMVLDYAGERVGFVTKGG